MAQRQQLLHEMAQSRVHFQLTVQQWGNSLAVRIPAAVAKSAGFKLGQPVKVSAQESRVLVTAMGPPRLTLAQKLAAFDPDRHAGEIAG